MPTRNYQMGIEPKRTKENRKDSDEKQALINRFREFQSSEMTEEKVSVTKTTCASLL